MRGAAWLGALYCALALQACSSNDKQRGIDAGFLPTAGGAAAIGGSGISGSAAAGSSAAGAGAGASGSAAGISGANGAGASGGSGNAGGSAAVGGDGTDGATQDLDAATSSDAAQLADASDSDAGQITGCSAWPAANGSQTVSASIQVSGTYDGKLERFIGSGDLGSGGQAEGQDPIFNLADGAVLKNVILGAPAADGIHCNGSCTLQNVWWEDVGEDAATFRATSASATMTIECAGAKHASDKVLQHNGPGTLIVKSFYVEDFGKLYRSCGNCSKQYERHVQLHDIDATSGKALVGLNTNYHDSATFENIVVHADSSMKLHVCDKYTGNDTGAEPPKTGTGADSTYCLYKDSDIHWLP